MSKKNNCDEMFVQGLCKQSKISMMLQDELDSKLAIIRDLKVKIRENELDYKVLNGENRGKIDVLECVNKRLRARVAEMEKDNKRLREALTAYIKFSAEVYQMVDSDLDVKALKLLGAMAGKDGYRQDVDAARAALAGKEE
jgi:C4-type Zn-finger protein